MSLQGPALASGAGDQQQMEQAAEQLAEAGPRAVADRVHAALAPEAGLGPAAAGPMAAAAATGAASSNYDFVKIKVRLGTQLEHYYILSRFLLSRMLTVITLPQHKAVRVALDVKKHLVDHSRLDITQEELEEVLFTLLRQRGYGDEYVRRYQMVTRFFQQKRPLIILVAGSACTGKSSLAQQLASRLNLPNVLQTDVLYELLRASGMGDLPAEPLWRRAVPPGPSAVAEFQRECGTIRQALDGELCKCIRDGKSIIIEGLHLDPGLFLSEFGDPRGEAGALAAAAQPAGGAGLLAGKPGTAGAAAADVNAVGGAAAAAVEQQLAELQLGTSYDAVPGLPAVAEEGVLPNGIAQAAGTTAASSRPHSQHQPRQQQHPRAGSSAGMPEAAAGVRRTASFGDAVARLSYGSLHRQQSPWKDAGSSKPLLRPRSARTTDRLGQRGQAVFMLQSTDGSEVPAGDGEAAPSSALPPPVPSPRLSACISLPTVREHSPERQQQPAGGSISSTPLPSRQHAPIGSRNPAQAAAAVASTSAVPPLHLDSPEQQHGPEQPQQQEQLSGSMAPAGSHAVPQVPSGQLDSPPAVPSVRPAQHSSVAAADAAAAAAAGTGPVFVPICLAVPDGEYEGMLHDWLELQERAHAGSSSGSGGGIEGGPAGNTCTAAGTQEGVGAVFGTQNGSACPAGASSSSSSGGRVPASEGAARLRAVQSHLRRYGTSGVPVVELDTSDMGAALDAMHAYVLQCIALATGERDYQ
ncbi:hypothetical protein ABPG75_007687 [Micractinium tetrahymenae]